MAYYELAYGTEKVALELPDSLPVTWIEPGYVEPAADPIQVVRDALAQPVDGRSLRSFASVDSVAIAINDKTRPVPHAHLLPPLLEELHRMGIPAEKINFFIATGTHLPMPTEELDLILPPGIISTYSIISHVCDDEAGLVYRGTTSRGTPVWGNRQFLKASLRIVVGNIEPHHFAGFSGGYKTAAIGLVGRQTINHNHAMLVEPGARIAAYDQNPLRQDIEEIGDALDVHYALNAILNGDKRIVAAVSGSPRAVMQAGIPISQRVCQIPTPGKYDLVIASVGGAPKDINFYQSQKALTHASLFTRDGGVIVLVAACPEGTGSQSYETFMEGVTDARQVFHKFAQLGFQVGPHKAFQVARDAARVRIILVSEINPARVSSLLMTPAASVEQAVNLAFENLSPTPGENTNIAILPRATNTIPV